MSFFPHEGRVEVRGVVVAIRLVLDRPVEVALCCLSVPTLELLLETGTFILVLALVDETGLCFLCVLVCCTGAAVEGVTTHILVGNKEKHKHTNQDGRKEKEKTSDDKNNTHPFENFQ